MLKKFLFLAVTMFTLHLCAESPVVIFQPFPYDAGYKEGALVNDVVMAELSCSEAVKLVDREELGKVLKEKSLQFDGMLSGTDAAQLSTLLGANYFLSGSMRISGEKMTVFARVLSVKTGVVKIGYITEKAPFDAVETGRKITEKLIATLAQHQPEQEKSDSAELPLIQPEKVRPAVVVLLPELHIAQSNLIDPAAENLLTNALIQQKFKVLQPRETLSFGEPGFWDLLRGNRSDLLKIAKDAGASCLVYGEAIAEKANDFGNFHTARARVELKVIRVEDGAVIFAQSSYAGAADTAEVIAGKRAIQLAAQKLVPELVHALLKK